MHESDLRHMRYLMKVTFVVLPGHVVVTVGIGAALLVVAPVQIVSWLFGSRRWKDTAPYRQLVDGFKRYDAWADRFIGNPWLDDERPRRGKHRRRRRDSAKE